MGNALRRRPRGVLTVDHLRGLDRGRLQRLFDQGWLPPMAGAEYDNIISRADASALMPEETSNEFLVNLSNESSVLTSFTRVPVGRAQVRFPVLSALPVAYWVTGDTGLKQTSETNWRNKYLNIEEIAVIVPVPDNTLDDTDMPIWDQVRPLCEQAAGRLLDETTYFGANAPSSFPTNIVAAATAAGNIAVRGSNNAAAGGIVGDHGDMLGRLEEGGFDATGGLAARTFKGFVRRARNTQGNRFAEIQIEKDAVTVDGVTYTFPMRGEWPTGSGAVEAIAVDGAEFVVGVRQDVTWKLLDQAVIQDNTGAIVYNLAQQDMSALRLTMRVGWQVSNRINYDQPDETRRYPAAVLTAP